MKYICLFLTILILCSCLANKEGAKPSAGRAEALLATPEITPENVVNDNPNQYTFKFINGTYWDMNDLTYFLSDTSIKSLSLYKGTFHDLSPLAELTELEELYITSNEYIADISPIGSLVNLKRLRLSNYAREEGLEALSSLVNLRHLNIFHKDRYYRELLPLQKLEVLILHQDIHAYLDVSYIAQLHSLKELEISSGFMIRESIENTEQLKNLVNLEELKIGGVVDLDISWMTHLQKLKRLSFVGCTINDVSPLLELPNLISVDFYLTPVTDITPLLESKSIKRIDRLHVEEDDVPSRSELFHLFRERGIEFFPFYSDR